jgi:hypothetical protein
VSGAVQFIIESRVSIAGDRGTFTVTGAIEDSGMVITRRSAHEDRVVKEREFRGALGTMFIHMEGSILEDGTGADFAWKISGATGEYEGLTGSGNGRDTFIGTARLRGDFSGTVTNRTS